MQNLSFPPNIQSPEAYSVGLGEPSSPTPEVKDKKIKQILLTPHQSENTAFLRDLLAKQDGLDQFAKECDRLFDKYYGAKHQALMKGIESVLGQLIELRGSDQVQFIRQFPNDKVRRKLLCEAIFKGNLPLVKLLLKLPEDLLKCNRPLLHSAVMCGQETIVKFLIEIGACINEMDSDNDSALNIACYRSHFGVAGLLIEAGAKCNEKDIKSALKDLTLLKLMVAKGVNLKAYPTLLHKACDMNELPAIEYLISQGLDVNAKNAEDLVPLRLVNDRQVFKKFIQLAKSHGLNINAKSDDGSTILMSATENGMIEDVELLFELATELGLDVNAKNNKGETAYCQTFWTVNDELMQLFRDKAKELSIDLTISPEFFQALLREVCLSDDNNTDLEFLLNEAIELHVDVNHKNKSGHSVFYIACYNGRSVIVQTFLKYALKLNLALDALDEDGITPLMVASDEGHLNIVKQLLQAGVNPLVRDPEGHRAIHFAILAGRQEVVDLLLPFERHPWIPQFLLDQIVFCNRFGINPSFSLENKVHFGFNSLSPRRAHHELMASIKAFAALPAANFYKSKSFKWEEVIKALDCSIDHFVSRNLSQPYPSDILALLVGWEGHLVSLAYSFSLNILVFGNRGDQSLGFPGLGVFQVRKPEQVLNVLTNALKKMDSLEGRDYLTKEMSKLLDFKALNYIHSTDQKFGHCVFDAMKLLFKSVIYLSLLKADQEDKTSIAQVHTESFYKALTSFDRVKGWNKFAEEFKKIEALKKVSKITNKELQEEGIIPEIMLREASRKPRMQKILAASRTK